MATIIGFVNVTIVRNLPGRTDGEPSTGVNVQSFEKVTFTGQDFGLEEGEGDTDFSIHGIYVAYQHPVRVQLNLDIAAIGAFRDPVNISALAEISVINPDWSVDESDLDLEVVFG